MRRAGRFNVVVVWALDRLGRSLIDLLDRLNELDAAAVALVLHQQAIDTTPPAGSWEPVPRHGGRGGNRYSLSPTATGEAAGETSCHETPRQPGPLQCRA
jgi:hypothetical protein